MKKAVYAFGPIAGQTYLSASSWRDWLAQQLYPHGITVLSPLRFKSSLRNHGVLSGHGRDYEPDALTTDKAVLARDKFDVLRADMLAGYFLGADRVSIGSMFEMAWAHEAHKPIAVAVPFDGQTHPHDHLFFNETADFRVHSLEDLRDVCIAVLG